jgi:hypothetical protein
VDVIFYDTTTVSFSIDEEDEDMEEEEEGGGIRKYGKNKGGVWAPQVVGGFNSSVPKFPKFHATGNEFHKIAKNLVRDLGNLIDFFYPLLYKTIFNRKEMFILCLEIFISTVPKFHPNDRENASSWSPESSRNVGTLHQRYKNHHS